MRSRRILAMLVAVVMVLAACGDDDDDTAEPGGDTETTETTAPDDGGDVPAYTIEASDYEFGVPDDLQGGVVELTLDNTGAQVHEAAFFRVTPGTTVEQFTADVADVFDGGAFPDYWEDVTGIPDVEGGESQTTTLTLPAGEYILMCSLSDEAPEDEGDPEGAEEGAEDEATPDEDDEGQEAPPHFELGMIQQLTVDGDSGAELPEADGTVTARDYAFDIPALEAGSHTLTFRNEGPEQVHHGIFFEFPEGVDEAGARAAVEAFGSEEPPPEGTPEPDEVGFTFVFSPGLGGTFDLELQSGRTYAVLCFIQDRSGGPPHAFAYDMVEIFTVS